MTFLGPGFLRIFERVKVRIGFGYAKIGFGQAQVGFGQAQIEGPNFQKNIVFINENRSIL